MNSRKEAIEFCKTFDEVYEDYPFRDENWTVMRHKQNKKSFACIYERQGHIWINVKCDPTVTYFWRSAFKSVVPGYHMNKEHWNSIILDGSIEDDNIKTMICDSYELTIKKKEKSFLKR